MVIRNRKIKGFTRKRKKRINKIINQTIGKIKYSYWIFVKYACLWKHLIGESQKKII